MLKGKRTSKLQIHTGLQERWVKEKKKILHEGMTNTCPNFSDQYSIRNYILLNNY